MAHRPQLSDQKRNRERSKLAKQERKAQRRRALGAPLPKKELAAQVHNGPLNLDGNLIVHGDLRVDGPLTATGDILTWRDLRVDGPLRELAVQ